MENGPIFIIGNPRSGTTLLRLILSAHPNIYIAQEGGFLLFLYEKYKNFAGEKGKILNFVEDLMQTKKIEYWDIVKEEIENYIIKNQPKNYSELGSMVYKYYGEKKYPGKKRWGDKNNYYLNYIDTINEIYPESKFIHIIRDGRDVACSYKDMSKIKNQKYAPNLPNQIIEIAENWKNNIETINASFNKINKNRYIEIKYEDLVQDTKSTVKELCDFLNEAYDENMLNYNKINLDREPEDYSGWKSLVKQDITTKRIKRWEEELTSEEIEIFEKIAEKQLKKYNYELRMFK